MSDAEQSCHIRRISSSALHRISPTIPKAGESIPPSARGADAPSPSPRLITCSRSRGAVSNLAQSASGGGGLLREAGLARLTSAEGCKASVYTPPIRQRGRFIRNGWSSSLVSCPSAVYLMRKAANVLANKFNDRHSALIAKPQRDAILIFFYRAAAPNSWWKESSAAMRCGAR